MNKIRFGITGSGFMGRTHAEAVKRLPDTAALVAVWGGSRAPALAERYGVACESSLTALARRPDIDAIIITTPHYLHAQEAILALESGKHVLIEKPMATTLADCDRINAAARRHGRVVGIGYQQRFRRNNIRARELIQQGAIGRVLTAQVAMPLYRAAASSQFGGKWEWWDHPESLGHLFNSAPHATDLMRWLTGAEIVQVSAFCRSFTPGLKVEDTTLTMMEFSNGTLFSLFSSNALPAPAWPGEDFRFRIMGSTGLMDLPPTGDLRVEDANGWRTESNQPAIVHNAAADTAFGDIRMQCYCDQLQAFIDGINGQPLRCGSAADGLLGVASCLAMLTSSTEQRWTQLGGGR